MASLNVKTKLHTAYEQQLKLDKELRDTASQLGLDAEELAAAQVGQSLLEKALPNLSKADAASNQAVIKSALDRNRSKLEAVAEKYRASVDKLIDLAAQQDPVVKELREKRNGVLSLIKELSKLSQSVTAPMQRSPVYEVKDPAGSGPHAEDQARNAVFAFNRHLDMVLGNGQTQLAVSDPAIMKQQLPALFQALSTKLTQTSQALTSLAKATAIAP